MNIGDLDYYLKGIHDRNRRIIAKAITLVESALPDHQEMAREMINRILPHTGKGIRLGITGIPGSGKSTFIESLGMNLVRQGKAVAVLAVDPSSSRSGGSILADKTRMEKLSQQEKAFIRPSPSGGTLGGVARKTRETMLICEAAGFDVLIVETVGVGQSETTVASMVDFFLLLVITGAGDELQGIKRGILELADAILVNKADGNNLEKAAAARKMYESALHLLSPSSPTWTPPVLTCSALAMTGIDEIWQTVLSHREKLCATGELKRKRCRQAVDWMWSMVEDDLKSRFRQHPEIRKMLPGVIHDVEQGAISSTAAANALLKWLDS